MSNRLLQVVAAVVALAAVAGGVFVVRERRAAEHRRQQIVEMKSALASMRDAIGSFRAANERYPSSLADLVKHGQLASVPVDPVTGSSSTWVPLTEERVTSSDDFSAGSAESGSTTSLIDVRSGAPGNDAAGKPWSSY